VSTRIRHQSLHKERQSCHAVGKACQASQQSRRMRIILCWTAPADPSCRAHSDRASCQLRRSFCTSFLRGRISFETDFSPALLLLLDRMKLAVPHRCSTSLPRRYLHGCRDSSTSYRPAVGSAKSARQKLVLFALCVLMHSMQPVTASAFKVYRSFRGSRTITVPFSRWKHTKKLLHGARMQRQSG